MDTIRRHSKRFAGTAVLVLVIACGERVEQPAGGPVTDDAYVAVMVDLLLLEAATPPGPTPAAREAAADSMRAIILEEHGVSSDEIVAFAESEGGDPGRMLVLWEQITHAYDSVRLARLRAKSEARSESEGKLGADAVRAAGGDSARAGGDTAAASANEGPVPSRLDSLLRDRRRRARERPGAPPD